MSSSISSSCGPFPYYFPCEALSKAFCRDLTVKVVTREIKRAIHQVKESDFDTINLQSCGYSFCQRKEDGPADLESQNNINKAAFFLFIGADLYFLILDRCPVD